MIKVAQEIVDKDSRSRRMVYQLTSPSGKSYIGVTKNFKLRIKQHLKCNNAIGYSLRKYGQENFQIKILGIFSENDAYKFEQKSVKHFNTLSHNGYNLNSGGIGGSSPSEETRKKISIGKKGVQFSKKHLKNLSNAQKGENNPNYGKIASIETRKKISEGNKLYWQQRKLSM